MRRPTGCHIATHSTRGICRGYARRVLAVRKQTHTLSKTATPGRCRARGIGKAGLESKLDVGRSASPTPRGNFATVPNWETLFYSNTAGSSGHVFGGSASKLDLDGGQAAAR